jgi:hypothetical protein
VQFYTELIYGFYQSVDHNTIFVTGIRSMTLAEFVIAMKDVIWHLLKAPAATTDHGQLTTSNTYTGNSITNLAPLGTLSCTLIKPW